MAVRATPEHESQSLAAATVAAIPHVTGPRMPGQCLQNGPQTSPCAGGGLRAGNSLELEAPGRVLTGRSPYLSHPCLSHFAPTAAQ